MQPISVDCRNRTANQKPGNFAFIGERNRQFDFRSQFFIFKVFSSGYWVKNIFKVEFNESRFSIDFKFSESSWHFSIKSWFFSRTCINKFRMAGFNKNCCVSNTRLMIRNLFLPCRSVKLKVLYYLEIWEKVYPLELVCLTELLVLGRKLRNFQVRFTWYPLRIYLRKNEEDILVFLFWKEVYSVNFHP